jgi:hypothetical protein
MFKAKNGDEEVVVMQDNNDTMSKTQTVDDSRDTEEKSTKIMLN